MAEQKTTTRTCEAMTTTRIPYQLPPNTYRGRCGKPSISDSGMPMCKRHKKLQLRSLINVSFKQLQRGNNDVNAGVSRRVYIEALEAQLKELG
jgi:hypothetical protein